jgi:hypothetical protein
MCAPWASRSTADDGSTCMSERLHMFQANRVRCADWHSAVVQERRSCTQVRTACQQVDGRRFFHACRAAHTYCQLVVCIMQTGNSMLSFGENMHEYSCALYASRVTADDASMPETSSHVLLGGLHEQTGPAVPSHRMQCQSRGSSQLKLIQQLDATHVALRQELSQRAKSAGLNLDGR